MARKNESRRPGPCLFSRENGRQFSGMSWRSLGICVVAAVFLAAMRVTRYESTPTPESAWGRRIRCAWRRAVRFDGAEAISAPRNGRPRSELGSATHGEWGVEAQINRDTDFVIGRRFELREEAVRWAESQRQELERSDR